jgi:hypothetical protein
MRLRRTTIVAFALMLSVLCSVNFSNFAFRADGEASGWQVDVYTQKQPYSGVGLGQPSDAFAPDDLVILYANVTYNGVGVQSVPVSFSVQGPPNPVYNITLSRAAFSDATGIAQTQFRINSPGEDVQTVTFGTWYVVAAIENASDYLTFKVGWIVEISSLDVNSGLDPPQGGRLGLQLSLSNLAMTPQEAELFISIYDSTGTVFDSIDQNITVDVGGSNFSAVVSIPMSASTGIGGVNASVFTLSGVPYSPSMSGTFKVSLFGDLNGDGKVDMADIAIAAAAFGSTPGSPRWNPAADVNKDHIVDLRDIALIAKRFRLAG